MTKITARWNGSEGKVSFARDYKTLTPVAKADFLKDAIWLLEQEYDKLIQAGIEGWMHFDGAD